MSPALSLLTTDYRQLSVLLPGERRIKHARRVCRYLGWSCTVELRIPASLVVEHEGAELYRGTVDGFCCYLAARFGRPS